MEAKKMAAGITIQPNESFENAYKRFKKAVSESGIINDYNRSQIFETRSQKRRRKIREAQQKTAKRLKQRNP